MVIKVLIIQVDGKKPNLALMKISAFHKSKGDEVFFRKEPPEPDLVYISCIFSKNKPSALGRATRFKNAIVGGSGVNYDTLPDEVEYIMPDYDLYGIDYSMGFTSRGCIRNCPWCVVPEKEGWIQPHQRIQDFLHPDHNKVLLFDGNLLACSTWKATLEFLVESELKVSFTQGNDIRLIDEEKAGLLADTKYYNLNFSDRMLYFSWDFMGIENSVEKGIQSLMDAGITGREITIYYLTGFDTTLDQDIYRKEKLLQWGVEPFNMPYNGIYQSEEHHNDVRETNRKWILYAKYPRTVRPRLP